MDGTTPTLVAGISEASSAPIDALLKLYAEGQQDDVSFIEQVIAQGLQGEAEAYRVYAETLGLPFTNPDAGMLDPSILHLFPEDVVRRYRAIPIGWDSDMLAVAMEDPLDLLALDAIQEVLGAPVIPTVCPPSTLEKAIERRLATTKGVETLLANLDLTRIDESAFASPQRLKEIAGDNAIIQLVDHFLDQALRREASDIHVEPGKDFLRLRYRIDGKLETVHRLPRTLHAAFLSRVKILALLDISERRRSQDGRFTRDAGDGAAIEYRVSTLPSLHGEKAVLRILDKRNISLELEEQGFQPAMATALKTAASSSNGVILVTGPTGSGKTTTLYGVLSFLHTEDRNLVTVEDPVEYQLKGITQVHVDTKADRTFATTLRSILRQDPDVIMVGEIRDRETAEITVHAALTGHIVLSTIHTNNAVGTVTRLLDMGIERYLVAPTLRAIVSQRLVRRLCPACSVPYDAPGDLLEVFGIDPLLDPTPFKTAVGCGQCRNRGFTGRIPIHELLIWAPELADALVHGASEGQIASAAREHGFVSMMEDGARKAAKGLTTLEEVLSAVRV